MIAARNADVKERKFTSVEGKPVHGEAVLKPLISGDQMTLLEVRYDAGAGAEAHVHQHESLVYVVKGRVKTTVGNETHILGPGDVCRHPKGVLHSVEGIDQCLVIEIKSPPQQLEKFLGISEK